MESKNIGKVVQIVGAVVDVRFEKDSLPDLLNAIEIDNKGEKLVVGGSAYRRRYSKMYRHGLYRWTCERYRRC